MSRLAEVVPQRPMAGSRCLNFVLSQADKHNGEEVSNYEILDFQDCCSALGLNDRNYTGCHFRWTNGSVWSKLDRYLVNSS
jgi:hypothetical protein